jgi:hypothetical protein
VREEEGGGRRKRRRRRRRRRREEGGGGGGRREEEEEEGGDALNQVAARWARACAGAIRWPRRRRCAALATRRSTCSHTHRGSCTLMIVRFFGVVRRFGGW